MAAPARQVELGELLGEWPRRQDRRVALRVDHRDGGELLRRVPQLERLDGVQEGRAERRCTHGVPGQVRARVGTGDADEGLDPRVEGGGFQGVPTADADAQHGDPFRVDTVVMTEERHRTLEVEELPEGVLTLPRLAVGFPVVPRVERQARKAPFGQQSPVSVTYLLLHRRPRNGDDDAGSGPVGGDRRMEVADQADAIGQELDSLRQAHAAGSRSSRTPTDSGGVSSSV
jgi:hypothetical protein